MFDHQDSYRHGVVAVQMATSDFSPGDWHRTVCGDWSAQELARHLLAVADWFHTWLDRAIDGNSEPPFAANELEDRSELAVYEHRMLSGPDAIEAFVASAEFYLERAAAELDRSVGYPAGTVPVAVHLGLAANEWHIHAWDLSSGLYRPSDPASLVDASLAARALTNPSGRIRQRLDRRSRKRTDPWAWMLADNGRAEKA